MDFSKEAKDALWLMFQSYIAAYGMELDDIFEMFPAAKELHTKLSPKGGKSDKSENMKEATEKSRRERIHRKLRTTRKHKHRDDDSHHKDPNFVDRIATGKTGNTRPTRGGNHIHNKQLNIADDLKCTLMFIRDNLGYSDQQLREAVFKFPYRQRLHSVVSHLVATRFAGWREDSGVYINESGHEASKSNWALDEEGRLRPRSHKPVDYKIDWLLEVRKYCGEEKEAN